MSGSFWRVCVVCGRRWYVRWPKLDCPNNHAIDRTWLAWLQGQYELRDGPGGYAKGQRVILQMVAQKMERSA